jgi:uncharacterized damage-inducible protein DinB
MRPSPTEYPAFFATYIDLVPSDDLLQELEQSFQQTMAILESLTEEQASFRYAPGKWTIKEVVGHMVDTERIMNYRALCIARGDTTPFPGFDEEAYVSHSEFAERSLQSLLQDFSLVRQASMNLLERLPTDAWSRVGTVNNNKIVVSALGFIIVGHGLHHTNVIRDRYMATF